MLQSEIGFVFNRKARGGQLGESGPENMMNQLERDYGWHLKLANEKDQISESLKKGIRRFLAMGGDGTIHWTINQLLRECEHLNISAENLEIGSIGAGSSNDFHKSPYGNLKKTWKSWPVRFDFQQAFSADLICVRSPDWDFAEYAASNVSIGLTAEANWLFNRRSAWWNYLKKLSTTIAIQWVSLEALIQFKSPHVQLMINGKSHSLRLTNLGIVKNPHFAGDFHYPQLVHGDDGKLGIFWVENLSRRQTIQAMSHLKSGQFSQIPQSHSEVAEKLLISSDDFFAVEMDGEVRTARKVEISVTPRAVRLCQ